ncbi:TraR/DksA family transcriptional regulator [Streptomyces spiramenti]|uniref:DNA-binding protein n=1 Tax=Streptomyces spiramenti TaxID=2720606 RepID=A0ABX1APK8_9ACTN|nr:TraR/DksA C4-type zinc finger protein [Streptomyces spiramenti]NJP67333.1 DNA-binding protein [Streptomyces spiramenti]
MVAHDDSAARRAVAKKAAKKASGTGRPVASAGGSATAAERSQARRATARAAADHDAAGGEAPPAGGQPDEGGRSTAGRATKKASAKRTAGQQSAARGGAARVAAPAAKPATKRAGTSTRKSAKPPKGAKGRVAAEAGPDAADGGVGTRTGRDADGAPAGQTGADQVAAEKTTASESGEPAPEGAIDPADLAVRPGEDPWTAAEVEEARTELTSDAARLREEIDATQQALTGLMRDSGDGAGDDQADVGTKNVTREHEMALAGNSREMLRQTGRALARLEAGTYGLCENCGQPIGKARMQAFPRATLCVACKQRLERRS